MPITGVSVYKNSLSKDAAWRFPRFLAQQNSSRVLCVYCASAGKPAERDRRATGRPADEYSPSRRFPAVSWIQQDDKVIRQVFLDMIDTQVAGDQPLQQTIMNAETKINSLIKSDMRKLFRATHIISFALAGLFLFGGAQYRAAYLPPIDCEGPYLPGQQFVNTPDPARKIINLLAQSV